MKLKILVLALLIYGLVVTPSMALLVRTLNITNSGRIDLGGDLPRLHVNGTSLYDSNGNFVQLRGLVSDCMVDQPRLYGTWSDAILEKFILRIKNAGANTLAIGFWYKHFLDRDTLDPATWGTWAGKTQYEHFIYDLDRYISMASKHGLYVYLRIHVDSNIYRTYQKIYGGTSYGTNPIWTGSYKPEILTAQEEYEYCLASLAARYGADPNFVGIVPAVEPPMPYDNYFEYFTWNDYKRVYVDGRESDTSYPHADRLVGAARAILYGTPTVPLPAEIQGKVIPILPVWNIGYEKKYGDGTYVFPIPELHDGTVATGNVMYYFHRYYLWDFNNWYTSAYGKKSWPHIPYYLPERYGGKSGTRDSAYWFAAKKEYAKSLNELMSGIKYFMDRGGCPLMGEAGWQGQYQAPYPELWYETSESSLIAMRHFFEILNEWKVNWVYFDAFGYQGYGIMTNDAEQGGNFPYTDKGPVWEDVVRGSKGTLLG